MERWLFRILTGIASLGISLSGCSNGFDVFGERRTVFPVLFDPRYSYQIYAVENVAPFPFDQGELVEIEAALMYHEVSDWIRSDVLPEAVWSASLIPSGEVQSLETLRVGLLGITRGSSYEIDWVIDNDAVLLVVSDSPLPPELFTAPRPGDTRNVCITLQVDEVEQDEEGGDIHLLLTLRPSGEMEGGLVRSEVRICEP